MGTVREYIESVIKAIEDHYFDLAMTDTQYERVWDATIEELPPMMDSGTDWFNRLVAAKLKGEDKIDSPKYTKEVMYDLELDSDELQSIANKNGKLHVCADIAEINGWNDIQQRALDCIYE
jgi:hypothetical protein